MAGHPFKVWLEIFGSVFRRLSDARDSPRIGSGLFEVPGEAAGGPGNDLSKVWQNSALLTCRAVPYFAHVPGRGRSPGGGFVWLATGKTAKDLTDRSFLSVGNASFELSRFRDNAFS